MTRRRISFSPNPVGSERKSTGARISTLHYRILVKRIEAEERTPGGILIPDTAKVLAVGSSARRGGEDSSPRSEGRGSRVRFGKRSGTEVIIDGEDRPIVKEADVLGVLESTNG
jgi:chaperonin GroES